MTYPKYLIITLWWNRNHPVKLGYTSATEDDLQTLRIGPLVTGWEGVEHD